MSPDIDWHVGEGAEREAITGSTSARRSRRWWLIVIVVIFGAGLGIAYRSIPDPTPPPTPTPTLLPTPPRRPIPAKLFDTLDREAQALAAGDSETYRQTRTQATADLLELQRQNFVAWGRPQDNRPLYTLVDFNLLTATSAWVDVRQFRGSRYFRETRFYYYEGERWLHGSTNRSLWSDQKESLQTSHFDVTHAVEDRDVISFTVQQLEEDYQVLCRDLGCAALGRELTFTVKVKPDVVSYLYPAGSGNIGIQLASPRVTGFFESSRAYTWENNFIHGLLAQEIGKRVLGLQLDGATTYEQPGSGLLWAGIDWALNRLDPLPTETLNWLSDLQQKPLLPLQTLWEIDELDEPGLAVAQLYYLLHFIEQEYGAAAVTHLLVTIHSAKSLTEAIETGLGVPFAKFDQKWRAWAKANIPSQ